MYRSMYVKSHDADMALYQGDDPWEYMCFRVTLVIMVLLYVATVGGLIRCRGNSVMRCSRATLVLKIQLFLEFT